MRFNNYYENRSELSLADQEQLYQQILDVIAEQTQDTEWIAQQVALHEVLFTLLGSTCFEEHVCIAGDAFAAYYMKQYVPLFCHKNKVSVIPSSELRENLAYSNTADITLAILPYELSLQPEIKNLMEDRMLTDSILILTHIPNEYIQVELCGKQPRNNKEQLASIREQIINVLQENDLERKITICQDCEDYATKYYQQLRFPDLKDELNEVKNALLDLQFGTDKAFYQQVVMQKLDILKAYL